MEKEYFRFAVFGRSIHTCYFVQRLAREGFPKPLVIVSEDIEYLRDKRLLEPYGLWGNLEELHSDSLCELFKLKTVNSKEAFELFKKYEPSLALSISCRNIIKKPVIDSFNGRIFNLHDSYLPNERGGALNTWRILNGIDTVGNTIHILDEGIDTGPIVVQTNAKINEESPEPINYLLAEKNNCEELVDSFLEKIANNLVIPEVPQENDQSYYFPRLHTEVNGLINWDWDVASIEKFIRAFGEPYPGAYSFLNKEKVHIVRSHIEVITNVFHPYLNGKIVTILDNGWARVISGGKPLVIEGIRKDGERVKPRELLAVGDTLVSPLSALDKAREYKPTTKSMNIGEKSL